MQIHLSAWACLPPSHEEEVKQINNFPWLIWERIDEKRGCGLMHQERMEFEAQFPLGPTIQQHNRWSIYPSRTLTIKSQLPITQSRNYIQAIRIRKATSGIKDGTQFQSPEERYSAQWYCGLSVRTNQYFMCVLSQLDVRTTPRILDLAASYQCRKCRSSTVPRRASRLLVQRFAINSVSPSLPVAEHARIIHHLFFKLRAVTNVPQFENQLHNVGSVPPFCQLS